MAQVKGIEKSIAAKKKEVGALFCTCDATFGRGLDPVTRQ